MDLIDSRFQILVLLANQFGHPRQPRPDGWVDGLEARKDLVSNQVPQVVDRLVGGVLTVGNLIVVTVGQNDRTGNPKQRAQQDQRLLLPVEEGALPWHPGETGEARPPQEVKQDRFGLVVLCMRRNNVFQPVSSGDPREEFVAQMTSSCLEVLTRLSGNPGNIGLLDFTNNSAICCQLLDKDGVSIGVFATQKMIEVRDHQRGRPPPRVARPDERVEQCRRVRST
jgi:hypothetical protein